ncbi:MAG: tail fiber protein [Marichromatium sp.]|nr:tail fiber protein [Marichromatium sp.]
MTVETASYVAQIDPELPSATDYRHEGDDHIRLIKRALANTFKSTAGTRYDLDAFKAATEIVEAFKDFVVPPGTIVAWSGTETDVPAGWVICDGRTYTRSRDGETATTPNLADRFLQGASEGNVGTTGGSAKVTITTATAGNHKHSNPSTGSAGLHAHGTATASHALTIDQIPWHNHGGGDHSHIYMKTDMISGVMLAGSDKLGGMPRYQDWSTTNAGTIIVGQGGGQGHQHGINADGAHAHSVGDTGTTGSHSHTAQVDTVPPFYRLLFILKA